MPWLKAKEAMIALGFTDTSSVRRRARRGKLERKPSDDGGFYYFIPDELLESDDRHVGGNVLSRSIGALSEERISQDGSFDDDVSSVSSDDGIMVGDGYVYNNQTDSYVTFLGDFTEVRSGQEHRAILSSYSSLTSKGMTYNQVAHRFEMPVHHLKEYLRIHKMTHDREPFTREEMLERSVEDMVEQALAEKRSKFHKEFQVRKWKEIERDAEKWRNFKYSVLDSIANMDLELPDVSVPFTSPDRVGDFSVVCVNTDNHIGKDDYSRERNRLREATEKICALVQKFGVPSEIITCCGSDFFQVDNTKGETERGTRVETCGDFYDTFRNGVQIEIDFIETLRRIAPVKIYSLPGNHDRTSSTALGVLLEKIYEGAPDVKVFSSPKVRHYHFDGSNLICFTHGDRTKMSDMPSVMAAEQPEFWGKAIYRWVYHGHLHHESEKEYRGATVTQMPSLSGTDSWHEANGYIGTRKSLAAYLHCPRDGRIGKLTATVR